jgi:hypothetical protein
MLPKFLNKEQKEFRPSRKNSGKSWAFEKLLPVDIWVVQFDSGMKC